jgi:hypothetical protein
MANSIRTSPALPPSNLLKTFMGKTFSPMTLVLGALLVAGCAGDDTVNPVPLPADASVEASKDASASDASTRDSSIDAGTTDAVGQ